MNRQTAHDLRVAEIADGRQIVAEVEARQLVPA